MAQSICVSETPLPCSAGKGWSNRAESRLAIRDSVKMSASAIRRFGDSVIPRIRGRAAQDRHWRNPGKKNFRERSNIKSVRASHWQAQFHAKWPKRQSVSALLRTRTQVAILTVTHLHQQGSYQLPERNGIWLVVFRHLQTNFLAHRTVVLRFFKLNIKARHEIRRFWNANLWSIHLIAFDTDWSWNIFTSHNFCSMLIDQLIDLENEKFRTDLRDRVMDSWSVTQ